MGSTPALAFSITADEQPLVDALNRANDHAKRSADSISAAFANVGTPMQLSLDGILGTLKSVNDAISTAMAGGAASMEQATLAAMNRAEAGIVDLADAGVKIFTSRFGSLGKILDFAWENTKGTVSGVIDDWSKRVAEFANKEWFATGKVKEAVDALALASSQTKSLSQYFSEMADNAKKGWSEASNGATGFANALSGALSTSLARTEQQMASASAETESFRQKLSGIADGIKSAIDVKLGKALPIEEFQKITDELEKQIKAHERQLALIGKTVEEAARLKAIWTAEDMVGAAKSGNPMSGEQKDAADALAARLAAVAAQEAGAKEAIRQAEQTKNLVAYVQQQAALQEANTAEVGKTAGEIARARVEAQVNLRITKEQLKLREDETKEIKEQLLIVEATANQRAMNAFDKGLDDAGRSAVANEQLALEMVGQRASEVARARFEQAEFNKAVHQGIPITGELSDRIHGWGQRLRDAAEAANTAKERIDQMAQFGQIASSMLEKGFMRWTQGAKVGWQDLVGAMLIDMEKLAFKMAVLQPIFGGGASGSGLIGQIAASLFGGGASGTTAGWTPTVSIDGARAGGGDIDGGKMYLVGENGPELIRPRADATVVPNGMFGSGTSVPSVGPSVVLNITAPAGTTARETSRSQDSDGGMTIDVLFEQIEARIGGGIADGSSPVGAAIQSTFGVSRAAGAR